MSDPYDTKLHCPLHQCACRTAKRTQRKTSKKETNYFCLVSVWNTVGCPREYHENVRRCRFFQLSPQPDWKRDVLPESQKIQPAVFFALCCEDRFRARQRHNRSFWQVYCLGAKKNPAAWSPCKRYRWWNGLGFEISCDFTSCNARSKLVFFFGSRFWSKRHTSLKVRSYIRQ